MEKHNCGKGPFEERVGIFLIRHSVGSIHALEAISKSVGIKIGSAPELRLARLFVAYIGWRDEC